MPAPDTITALGLTVEQGERVLGALRTRTWSGVPWVTDRTEPPVPPGRRIGEAPHADRYELLEVLGHGASGAVYRAVDRLLDERVAVKVLRSPSPLEMERMQREVSVLRMLRLPGVVAFRDAGAWENLPFVVMDLVGGAPFPGGTHTGWDPLAPVCLSLVETLARVHQAGVIHRDLKPANVQTVDGIPVLLDFGLARSELVRDEGTEGDMAGTPAYMAPEQFFGRPPSVQSDLYALGVMLYEAIGGRRPHTGETLYDLAVAVMFSEPAPLGRLAPEAPEALVRLVMRLLSKAPGERPGSAVEVLGILRDARVAPEPRVDRLGGGRDLEALIEAVRDGRSVDVGGPSGTGRTRLLEDAAARLEAFGIPVAWARPARAPLASLAEIIGDLGDAHRDLASARADAAKRLRDCLTEGVVVLADHPGQLDPSSAALLDRVRGVGPVVRVVDGVADITLEPLEPDALRPLFAGPEPLHHIPSDAADLVIARAGGSPRRVLELVGCWVRAGVAQWEGARVVIERASLDRLRAGLEMDPVRTAGDDRRVDDELAETWRAVGLLHPHATLERIASMTGDPRWSLEGRLEALEDEGVLVGAGGHWNLSVRPPHERWSAGSWARARRAAAHALPPDAQARLLRLLECDAFAEIPATARQVAAANGAVAWTVLIEALAVCRRAWLEDEIPGLLADLVCHALSGNSQRLLTHARIEIARSDPGDAGRLDALCALAEGALAGGGPEVLAGLEALDAYPRPEVELWRHRLAAFAGVGGSEEVLEAWLTRVRPGVEQLPGGARSADTWEARVRFRRGDFAGAAALHEAAFRDEPEATRANVFGLNAAVAWLEAGCFEDAARVLERVSVPIRAQRTPVHEALLESLRRALCYREGTLPDRDRELERAILALDVPSQTGPFFLTESAACWRRGAAHEAAELAATSAEAFDRCRRPWAAALARALAVRVGSPLEDVDTTVAEALSAPFPAIALQAVALLGVGSVPGLPAPPADGYPPAARREVLSMEESLRRIDGD